MLKVFFLSNTNVNQLPYQPDSLTVIAESEKEALSMAKEEHGNGYECLNSCDVAKGIIDVD